MDVVADPLSLASILAACESPATSQAACAIHIFRLEIAYLIRIAIYGFSAMYLLKIFPAMVHHLWLSLHRPPERLQ